MKKYLSILVLLSIGTSVFAQEKAKETKGIAEVTYGWLSMGNYSNISLFEGGNGKVSMAPMVYTTVGYGNVALKWGVVNILTYADSLNERMSQSQLLLGFGDRYMVGDKWMLKYSIDVGLLVQHNGYRYQNTNYSVKQYGLAGKVDVSMNYMLTKHLYLGLGCNVLNFGMPFSPGTETLPVGLKANPRDYRVNYGYGLMFFIGSKF